MAVPLDHNSPSTPYLFSKKSADGKTFKKVLGKPRQKLRTPPACPKQGHLSAVFSPVAQQFRAYTLGPLTLWHPLRGVDVLVASPEVFAIAATSGYCLPTLRVEERRVTI